MKRSKQAMKLYVIRKYVMATSVIEAAKIERQEPAHDIFIEERWQDKHLTEAMGFTSKEA